MKITLEREEVEAIVKDYILALMPDVITGKKVTVSGSTGYSDWEVRIEDPEPEPEKKEVIDKLESGDHEQLPLESEVA